MSLALRLAPVVLVLALAAPSLPATAQPGATPVGVDTVQREAMSQTVPVIGRLVAPQSGVVAARTGGLVEKFFVEVGDRIEQDQPLAVLDLDFLRASLALAEAELKEFKAQRDTEMAIEKLARQQLERLEKLRGTAAFNQSLYDDQLQKLAEASSTRQEMEARIARGEINVLLARTELEYGTIRAPFTGTVTRRSTNEGAWLQRGDPVITMINDDTLEIEADVPASNLVGVTPGSRIEIVLDDGTRHQARVRAVIPDENPASRTRPVRLVPEFDKIRMPLAVNQPVTLLVPAGGMDQVVSVHKDAVLHKGGRSVVFVVKDGVAQSRPVQLGEAVGSRLQVLEGLQPGDVVVVRGNERLRPGQPVSYPGQEASASIGKS